jgi:hypothetical protein
VKRQRKGNKEKIITIKGEEKRDPISSCIFSKLSIGKVPVINY